MESQEKGLGNQNICFRHSNQNRGGVSELCDVFVYERKYINQENGRVIVSFELSSHDWLKVENSDAWKEVVRMLQEIQSKHNQKSHPIQV